MSNDIEMGSSPESKNHPIYQKPSQSTNSANDSHLPQTQRSSIIYDDPDEPTKDNFYKRFANRFIPTIQTTLSMYQDSGLTKPESLEEDSSTQTEVTKSSLPAIDDEEVDEEVDMAKADLTKPQRNLLDMIVSSLVCTDVYKFLHSRGGTESKDKIVKDEFIRGYGIIDSEDEPESGQSEPESGPETEPEPDTEPESDSESEANSEADSESVEFEDAKESNTNTDDNLTLKSVLLDHSLSNSSSLLERLQIDNDPINHDNLSIFQKSILNHLKFFYDGGVLMKFKEDFEKLENNNDIKILKIKLKIADRLQKVFQLLPQDEFYSGYTTWLVRDVFLQGHVYLTKDALLYFAFLPRRYSTFSAKNDGYEDDSDFYIQEGCLTMKTKKYGEILSTVLTTRLWAILRSGTLSIYSNATDLYFPRLIIDLRSCVKVEILDKYQATDRPTPPSHSRSFDSPSGITSPRESMSRRNSDDYLNYEHDEINKMLAQEVEENKEELSAGVWFKITTTKKSYKFQTDNMYSAREWVNNITKLMFQIHNSNFKNEVLIKIPFSRIIHCDHRNLFDISEKKLEFKFNDELPAIYSVRYKTASSDSKMPQKIGERMKSKAKGSNDIETLYFAFFTKSKEFNDCFNKILNDRAASSPSTTLSSDDYANSLLSRMKLLKAYLDESISTLVPGGNSDYIIDQISSFNSGMAEFMDFSNASSDSKIKKFGKSLSSKMFPKSKRSNSSSSLGSNVNTMTSTDYGGFSDINNILPRELMSPSSELSHDTSISCSPIDSGISPPGEPINRSESTSPSNINLPRQLSLTGLKNLNMSFELSKKKLKVAEDRYNTEDDRESQKWGELDLEAPVALNAAFPGVLNLTDPSEYDDSDKRENKLKYLGRSIKALSNASSLWNAQPNHYIKMEGKDSYYVADEGLRQTSERHFRNHFSLSNNNNLIASYSCHVIRALPVYGKLYIGNEMICFRSLLPGVSTRMILPLKDIAKCYGTKGTKITYSGLILVVKGKNKLFIEFSSQKSRDDCLDVCLEMLDKLHESETWIPEAHDWGKNYDLELDRQRMNESFNLVNFTESSLKQARIRIENARVKLFEDRFNVASGIQLPLVLEDSPFFKTEIKPSTSYNFVLLTIGSRGDVQPYIALGKGLIEEGHKVTIATHAEFEEWITGHGILFKEIAGDPGELMSLMVTHGSLSVAFIKEASAKFRGWINDLLRTSWLACQNADILIESPSAMGGVHIAEALGIPYMRAFTMPWTRTRAYSHAFVLPDQKKGGSYNYLTHVMFETVFWKAISSQINKWRTEVLDLPKTNLYKLQQTKIPFLYNVSLSVLPPAVDFPDWIKVTGYWFLDEAASNNYKPPQDLQDFITQAHQDQKKLVYIGFGSIVVSDAKSLTTAIIEAVLEADVRCILNKGWSDRLNGNKDVEVELPPEIFNSGAIPHDWLFPRIDAAVHHGGSGTTGATLRGGLPTIIKPFFGDQFFYAFRVEEIGVGIALRKLNGKSLAKALKVATSDIKMIEKAKRVSEKIRNEHGVLSAIEAIYLQLEYSRSLIINKQLANEQARLGKSSGAQTPATEDDDTELMFDEDDDISTLLK